LFDFSPTGWGRIILATALGTLVCVAAAFFVDSFNFGSYTPEQLRNAILINTFLPIALAGPMIFYLMWQTRRLALAHRELQIVAATDSLTSVLNRGAFTMLVDAYLQEARKKTVSSSGALLIVDADHFKVINDRFGHKQGDRALVTMTQKIKEVLRDADIVGRIGGEEFGVFLPDANFDSAGVVGERIRHRISRTRFQPNDTPHTLTVSVGGVAFENAPSYDELFVIADKYLYDAKAKGRNRVRIGHFGDGNEPALPEAVGA
jgi:diguanylate cyclase (GGDEF)-like protein